MRLHLSPPAALVLALSWAGSTTAADKTAADYFVHSLPGAPEGPLVKMHAGHIEVDPKHNSNLFFWHFQNKHIANKQRTVIWLNGGPGCSSEDGALMEVGPYRLKNDTALEYNNGTWNEFANLMFVDNPVGTGFSYADTDSYLHELDEMAAHFLIFLEKWFQLFPEYEHDDLYLAGESFAGQHIPYIAKAILARNKKQNVQTEWNLQGLLIGNGWISPKEQYEAYLTFAYEKNLVKKGSKEMEPAEQQWNQCQNELKVGPTKVDYSVCEAVLQDILRVTSNQLKNNQCINMYDVRLTDTYPSCGMNWPPDLVHVKPYLRQKEVVEALHIDPTLNTGWQECNGAVGQAFKALNSKPAVEFLPEILSKVPVMLFSGAEDLICNHKGTEQLIGNMEWNGGKGFEVSPSNWAPRRDWTFEGEAAGFWQEARNLTYVLFYNSSHMVPFDYPRRTRDMLDRFMDVDISSIGGTPTDSRLDGEKGPETTVGGTAGNSTQSQEEEEQRLSEVKWAAYYRAGTIVLIIVAIAAAVWGYFIWRERRRRQGYQGLAGGENGAVPLAPVAAVSSSSGGLDSFRHKRGNRDVEAGDFDESELDDVHVQKPAEGAMDHNRYSIGGASDDEDAGYEKGPSRS